jgi:RNA polymerase primary sigma factor
MAFLKAGASKNRGTGGPIGKSVLIDDEERARRLIAMPGLVNQQDMLGRTLLHRAAQKGKSQVCRILLEGGADATIMDASGLDAATLAKLAGQTQIAKLITDHIKGIEAAKAPVPPLTTGEIVRLLNATLKTVESLIASGRRDAKDSKGNTILHLAAKRGALLAAEKLFSAGIATDTLNDDGKTAADIAQAAGHHILADMLRGKSLSLAQPQPQKTVVHPISSFEDFEFDLGETEVTEAEVFHTEGGFGDAAAEFDWSGGPVKIVGEDGEPAPDFDLSDFSDMSFSEPATLSSPPLASEVGSLFVATEPARQVPERTDTFLDVRKRGRRSRKLSRPSELSPVTLAASDARAWLAERLEQREAGPESIRDLIDLCQGGWDDDLAANIARFLEDCGIEEEDALFDPLADLDLDEMTEGLMALCNRAPVLVGQKAFTLAAHEERQLLAEIRRTTTEAEFAIAGDEVSRSAVIALGRGVLESEIDPIEVSRLDLREAEVAAREAFREHLDDLEILHQDWVSGFEIDTWTLKHMAEAVRGLALLPEILEGLAEAVHAADPTRSLPVVKAVQAQRKTIHAFLVHHLPWVRLFASREARDGEEVEDILQVAWLGMRRAFVRFDPDRGNRFMTYSAFWMSQVLTRSRMDEASLVRIPTFRNQDLQALQDAKETLEMKGLPLTDAALAKLTGFEQDRISLLRRIPKHPEELDPYISDPDATDRGFEAVLGREREVLIDEELAQLTDRGAAILKARFGFGDGEEKTLAELGQSMGVTRERIRQIEAKCLDLLAKPSRLGNIRRYL